MTFKFCVRKPLSHETETREIKADSYEEAERELRKSCWTTILGCSKEA